MYDTIMAYLVAGGEVLGSTKDCFGLLYLYIARRRLGRRHVIDYFRYFSTMER